MTALEIARRRKDEVRKLRKLEGRRKGLKKLTSKKEEGGDRRSD
jgi:hypothetical protein